jgi:hypothetical protein
MRDMLEFVDDVDAVSKITKLQSIVRSMMTQIYECALFIQAYGGVGLTSMCRNLSLSSVKLFDTKYSRASHTGQCVNNH